MPRTLFVLCCLFFSTTAIADQTRPESLAGFDACLQRGSLEADGFLTLADLREICAREPNAFGGKPGISWQPADDVAIDRRLRLEEAVKTNPFAITPHAPNYLLPLTYMDRRNPAPLGLATTDLDNIEIKLQLSYKLLVAQKLFWNHGDLYFAYTNTSWWQAFNRERSSPFRETNHEPEIFLSFDHPWRFKGIRYAHTHIGFSHESNGQSGLQSRSWNRLYARLMFQKDAFYLSVKPWLRINEKAKTSPTDPTGDDNPDITDFTGHGELSLFYKWSRTTLSVLLRNNLKSDNRGSVEIGYSFPLTPRLRAYAQFFNGYAESLIDYNHHSSRIGIGVQLNEWL